MIEIVTIGKDEDLVEKVPDIDNIYQVVVNDDDSYTVIKRKESEDTSNEASV